MRLTIILYFKYISLSLVTKTPTLITGKSSRKVFSLEGMREKCIMNDDSQWAGQQPTLTRAEGEKDENARAKTNTK